MFFIDFLKFLNKHTNIFLSLQKLIKIITIIIIIFNFLLNNNKKTNIILLQKQMENTLL